MKKICLTITGLLVFGLASAQVDTINTVAQQPLVNGSMPAPTTTPSVAPPNTARQPVTNPGNTMSNPALQPAPTAPPNTNGIPPSPMSPQTGPLTTPTTAPTQPAIHPGVPQRP